ncbi:MAG: hypothetical protein EXS17_07315 [Phycisphaerales bacterium]|nr:hypothetical protein [Phycisphaerales bacterium]
MIMRRRSRRRRRRKGAATTDAFELFLDALCNALGVILFILLCVVVFAKSPDGDQKRMDPEQIAAETKALDAQAARTEAQLTAVLAALSALPPSGDPESVRRRKELLGALDTMRTKKLAEVEAEKQARARLAASGVALVASVEKRNNLAAQLARLDDERKKQLTMTQFVRVARLRADGRKAVLILCADGRVSIATLVGKGQEIAEPVGVGIPVTDEASARLAIAQLFGAKTPDTFRAEVAVWPSGFAAYKRLERVMIEKRFGINPLPVAAGEPIREGAGGIQ